MGTGPRLHLSRALTVSRYLSLSLSLPVYLSRSSPSRYLALALSLTVSLALSLFLDTGTLSDLAGVGVGEACCLGRQPR